jgi:type VI secretion system ImpC/EvpB family protein
MNLNPVPANEQPDSSGLSTDSTRQAIPPSIASVTLFAAPTLLDTVVETSQQDGRVRETSPPAGRLKQFLQAESARESLALWFGGEVEVSHGSILVGRQEFTKAQLARRLNHDVARIDSLLNEALNAILHHPEFQKLEGAWRGLSYLTEQLERASDPSVKIKVLNVSWRDLERDFDRAEFDQSQLFKKVYEEEFGLAGGEPLGVLIANYEVHPFPSADHPHDDVNVLKELAKVGAAAFCPVIANASPAIFGIDDFQSFEHTIDHSATFAQQVYLRWRGLRDMEEARFLGVALPRVLMRLPYADDGTRVDRFQFREDVSQPNRRNYLWGGAAFAMGEVLIRAFASAGWLADIRGAQRGVEKGGLVSGLPVHSFGTDRMGVATKISTDVIITDTLEKQLSDLGFIPLCHCKDTEYSVFYSNNSVQKPKKYDRSVATINARISAMLQYMFCVSRFAHYVKVLARDKLGSYAEAHEFEDFLQRWIVKYVTSDAEATPEVKARFPLRDASVSVRPVPGRPGSFNCVMHLAPHYELDEVSASVRLVAELTPGTRV